ncbi:amidohydrolase [Nesterenkonia lutea]|uniref:Amidohydrolase YtcJ n=1 Tax=Nesterenkonia lutea TaxID=272919 RepID=A0ABR9JHU2_9MICC|nr:amidohydrolase family protein [Nesterenkonia lutea]MBE1525484.1 putative amidohydrolase YtcJ [Nesterenkonia lutea]
MSEQMTAYSGEVFTATEQNASVVVVRGRFIEAVGDEALLDSLPAGTPVVKIKGLLVPGFVDAHTHVTHTATGGIGAADCRVPHVRSIADIIATLRKHSEGTEGTVLGYGNLFYDRKLSDRRLPTRDDLDQVSTSRQVILRCGGHISILNTVALERIEDRALQGHTGTATVFKDAKGRATGAVAEADAELDLPRPGEAAIREEMSRILQDDYLRHGVTTVGEICESRDTLEALRDAVQSKRSTPRVRGYLLVSPALPLKEAVFAADELRDADNRFSLDGIKVFVDGGYSSRTAAVSSPYLDTEPEHAHGSLALTAEELGRILREAAKAEVSVAVHVNGDRAQKLFLESLPEKPNPRSRLRAEHAGNWVYDWKTVNGLIERGVTLVVNPGFFHSYIGDEFPRILGDVARKGRMPIRSLLQQGAHLAAGADAGLGAEISQSWPAAHLWNLCSRPTRSGDSAEPEETVSVEDALKVLSIGSARALGIDHQVGSIEAGKYADLVELKTDPRKISPESPREIQARRVVLQGDVVYGDGDQ